MAIDSNATDSNAATPPADFDPRPQFASAIATTGAVVGGLRADQLDLPTPCDAYDVRELSGHLLCVLGRGAALGRRVDIFTVPQVVPFAPDELASTWASWASDATAAWADAARLEEMIELPWATAPGAATLSGYVNELVVHGWELARATGQSAQWDPAAIAVADAAIRAMLPPGNRVEAFAEMMGQRPEDLSPEDMVFANEVPVPADAPAIDRLVAYTGRNPS